MDRQTSRLLSGLFMCAVLLAAGASCAKKAAGTECGPCRNVSPTDPSARFCDPGMQCINNYCVRTSCTVPSR